MSRKVAFAIGAHPDDIEFMMAGTLLLLKQRGYEIHMMNVANGNCGTATESHNEIVRIRTEEARQAAKFAGATLHPSLVNDIEIFYEKDILIRIAAIMRIVNPQILLVPSPQDYMEDHANVSRLAVTAAFCRSMLNYITLPPVSPVVRDTAIYHALPYGLRDGLRRRGLAGQYVDIGSVLDLKRDMLALHHNQKV